MKNYWIIGVVVIVLLGAVVLILQQKSSLPTTSQTSPEPIIGHSEAPMTTPQPTTQIATDSGGQSEARMIEVTGSNFKFSPSEIKVKQGDKIVIHFIAKGGVHDLVIDGYNVATKQTSSEDTIEFIVDKTGTFEYYCSIGNHRQMGMIGKLIVE